jgi:hypothetical protein
VQVSQAQRKRLRKAGKALRRAKRLKARLDEAIANDDRVEVRRVYEMLRDMRRRE